MVVQTSVATAAQQVTIHVTGGLPTQVVHVWSTNLRGPGQFIQRADIIPHKGAFAALLQPGYVLALAVDVGPMRRTRRLAVDEHAEPHGHAPYGRPHDQVEVTGVEPVSDLPAGLVQHGGLFLWRSQLMQV